jgi:hypothetical protein
MQIKTKLQILKAESREFPGKNRDGTPSGKMISYNTVRALENGCDLYEFTTTKEIATELIEAYGKIIEATLTMSPDYKDKARVKLTAIK